MVDMESIGLLPTAELLGGIQEQSEGATVRECLRRSLRAACAPTILAYSKIVYACLRMLMHAYADASAGLRTPGFAYAKSLLPLLY